MKKGPLIGIMGKNKVKGGNGMQSAKISALLDNLPEEDYGKAVSYIKFLIDNRQRNAKKECPQKHNVSSIVDSLVGILPDDGRTLDDYRTERLKKYETAD